MDAEQAPCARTIRSVSRPASDDVVLRHDVQASAPRVHLSLTRAGVTGIQSVIRIAHGGKERLYAARLECTVDLDPAHKGVHMSRFPEQIGESIERLVIGESLHIEELASAIAREMVGRQGALRSQVRIEAIQSTTRTTPRSGLPSQEISTLIGVATASERAHAPRRRRAGARHHRLPVRAGPGARSRRRAPGRARLRRGGSRAHPRHRPDRHAQPARRGHAAARHARARAGRAPRGDRRGLHVGADPDAAQASRRAARGRAGARQPALRRGRRARDGGGRRRGVPRARGRRLRPGPSAQLRDDPRARRDRRAHGPAGRAAARAGRRRRRRPRLARRLAAELASSRR